MAHGDPGVELLEPLEESGTPIFRVAKAAANRIEELQPLGAHMQRTLRFASMPELLATTRADAIIAADNRPALSHQQLKEFVENFDLARFGITVNDRVGVLLPDGPELGVCILAVMSYATCAPMNPGNTDEELKADLTRIHTKAVLVPADVSPDRVSAFESCGIRVLKIKPRAPCGVFDIEGKPAEAAIRNPSGVRDAILILATSGTSGTKKIVPYTLETIVIGAACVAASWALGPSDVNLNMMPLFHVGGIVRNLLAPLLTGGSSILCRGFDPGLFLDLADSKRATWYYAAPTMHHAVLQQWTLRSPPPRINFRMIGNAAGGLLPSLAQQIQETFHCTVLPSYGMTECMPITAPRMDYKLDRPGTSGRAVGPELAVMDDAWRPVAPMAVGNIVVRGPPVFGGYEADEKANSSAFNADGWFSTGDMGYLDQDGYIYITGRSKEVINRGGEIISPFEVEEALAQHPRIQQVLAFSALHDTLQEAVGVVVVPKAGKMRPDLPELHSFLGHHLHPSKWPITIVYMDDLPKNQTNKALRIGLAERLSLPEFTDEMPPVARLFEARCPPRTAALKSKIPSQAVEVNLQAVAQQLRQYPSISVQDSAVARVPQFRNNLVAFVYLGAPSAPPGADAELLAWIAPQVHDYLAPKRVVIMPDPIRRTSDGSFDLSSIPKGTFGDGGAMTPLEKAVLEAFQEVLGVKHPIGLKDDFFEVGGSSLKAGLLFALIHKRTRVLLPPMTIYQHRTIEALAAEIKAKAPNGEVDIVAPAAANNLPTGGMDRPGPIYNQYRPLALFVQALPMFVVQPVKVFIRFYIFISMLNRFISVFPQYNTWLRYSHMLVALALARVGVLAVFPLLGILLKWIIIGKIKPGRYPLWGWYYLRWWLVDQIIATLGRGLFPYNTWLLVWYYRLLGATIGDNVKVGAGTRLSEWDLIRIDDNCALDASTLRPFTMETGFMVLHRIVLKAGVTVGRKTIIAPGARVPAGAAFGPLSSSYEMKDTKPEYAELCRANFPAPHWLLTWFLGFPILFCIKFAEKLPWLLLMYFPLSVPFFVGVPNRPTILLLLIWFTDINRLPFRFLARIAKNVFGPFIYLFLVILIKRLILGRFKAGPFDKSQWNLFRHWLMSRLLPGKDLGGVTEIIGTHYEVVSVIYRLLGAKCGKRIYWPGSGIEFYEFDLLEVGNDVVFGSRSHIFCSDQHHSAPVKIGDGAMIADRCVLCPGVTVGKGTVMGSGSLGKVDTEYPAGSVWVGSQHGNAVLWDAGKGDPKSSLTPFARAFYLREASYPVLPLMVHITICVFAEIFTTIYWMLPINLAAVIFVKIAELNTLPGKAYHAGTVFGIMLPLTIIVVSGLVIIGFCIDIGTKWALMGRRKAGNYNWDSSSYCQRWQILLILSRIRQRCLSGRGLLNLITGSAYLVWYFRALGATIGKNVCLYPHGGDPMMTEPDLVTIKDDACVDDASLICHINSRGHFSLSPLLVGKGCVLRTGSRLLSGASMEAYSTLLEHTLIVSGSITPYGSVWQGWPASEVDPPDYAADRASIAYGADVAFAEGGLGSSVNLGKRREPMETQYLLHL